MSKIAGGGRVKTFSIGYETSGAEEEVPMSSTMLVSRPIRLPPSTTNTVWMPKPSQNSSPNW